jgi:hypothetical protein
MLISGKTNAYLCVCALRPKRTQLGAGRNAEAAAFLIFVERGGGILLIASF